MATIRDVAKTSGVSVATVSRVLNGDPVVTESTREKVQQAIKELDYRPNLLGKGLRQAQTKKYWYCFRVSLIHSIRESYVVWKMKRRKADIVL